MTMFDAYRYGNRRRNARLGGHLLAAMVVSLLVAAAPTSLVMQTKDMARRALSPGQEACTFVAGWANRSVAMVTTHARLVERLDAREAELRSLARRNAQLRSSLAVATLRTDTSDAKIEPVSTTAPTALDSLPVDTTFIETQPLVEPHRVRARVLGRQARAYLVANDMLSEGSKAGLSPGDLVFEDAADVLSAVPIIDQGRDAELGNGDLVLNGRHVWGRLSEVGPHTATVRRVDEPGYRDLVQLAHAQGGRLRLGPRGVLEGHGERGCRIQLVDVTQPVAVGDWVLAAAGDGVLERPPIYGAVVEVQRTAGGSHWEIWMKPAADSATADFVEIVSLRLNPGRVVRTDANTESSQR